MSLWLYADGGNNADVSDEKRETSKGMCLNEVNEAREVCMPMRMVDRSWKP